MGANIRDLGKIYVFADEILNGILSQVEILSGNNLSGKDPIFFMESTKVKNSARTCVKFGIHKSRPIEFKVGPRLHSEFF